MRWIFFALVAANLLLLVVNLQRPSEPQSPARVQPATAVGKSLVLLSERKLLPDLESDSSAVQKNVELPQLEQREERQELPPEGLPQEEQLAAQVGRAPGEELCTLIGPFPGELQAEYFQEHLSAVEVSVQIKKLEVPGEAGYWVYQAPQPSRQAALQRLKELQSRGIDSYVIPNGELANGISFGLFNLESGAHQRLGQVIEQGYEATIKKVDRSAEEIWVSMTAPEAEKIGEKLWLELLSREEGLEMRQNFCPAVASK